MDDEKKVGPCECHMWACAESYEAQYMVATNHHPKCPKGWPPEAQALIRALVCGMETWAADEDGVHYRAWDAYVAGRAAVGRPVTDPREAP